MRPLGPPALRFEEIEDRQNRRLPTPQEEAKVYERLAAISDESARFSEEAQKESQRLRTIASHLHTVRSWSRARWQTYRDEFLGERGADPLRVVFLRAQ